MEFVVDSLEEKLGSDSPLLTSIQKIFAMAVFESNQFLRDRAIRKLLESFGDLRAGQVVDHQMLLSYWIKPGEVGHVYVGDVPPMYRQKEPYEFLVEI